MTTVKYPSNKKRLINFYKHRVQQARPLTILSAIISLLLIVLPFFIMVSRQFNDEMFLKRIFDWGVFLEPSLTAALTFLFGVLSIVTAVYLFSFLHSRKTTDMYHSLPIKRNSIFLANFLAGMTSILLPFIITTVLTMLVHIVFYGKYLVPNYFVISGLDILSIIVYVPVVFLFTAIISVNSGRVFDTLAMTSIIGLMPLILYNIVKLIWTSNVYGAVSTGNKSFYFSPFSLIFQRYVVMSRRNISTSIKFEFILYFACIIIAAIFYFLGHYFYNKRKSEEAESSGSGSPLQIISKCFIAFLGAFIFFQIFSDVNIVTGIILMVIGGIVFGVVAEIVLSRGVRDLKKNFKWIAVSIAIFGVMFLSIRLDMFGYTNKIPNLNTVESVNINYSGRYKDLSFLSYYQNTPKLESEGAIEIVRSAHKAATENIPKDWNYYYSSNFVVKYQLKNGKTLERNFAVADIKVFDELKNLENEEEFVKAENDIFQLSDSLISRVEMKDEFMENTINLNLKTNEIEQLLEAVRTDILIKDLSDIKKEGQSVVAYLKIVYDEEKVAEYLEEDRYRYYGKFENTILVTPKFVNTIKLLNEKGYINELSANKPTYDAVELKDFKDRYGNSVPSYILAYNFNADRDMDSSKFVRFEEKSDIDTIIKASKNIVDYKESDSGSNVMIAYFWKGSAVVGSKIVLADDLPSHILAVYLDEENKEYSYTYNDGGYYYAYDEDYSGIY